MTDLVLGLLRPTSGQITVDDVVLDSSNTRAWQNNIGYVPQSIFLVDDTIARNIAFGIDEKLIDRERLVKAAQIAQIHDFIMDELQHDYSTIIGERGARLSGGQRQRLGIARALYHDPGVLIFDEATNALDQSTEAEVLAAIQRLDATKTVIVITHRLTTVESFDAIIKLEQGRVEFLATSYAAEPEQAPSVHSA
jgi:ABC-type bacteriocin/lantibiotic exporter with double-glycine peptidase domain